MIHKVENITSVGRFRQFQATGDIVFQKVTLIYADNGIGKTTLASIFRALALNDPTLVQKRVTTNATQAQAVQIIQRDTAGVDTHHTYRTTGWSNAFDHLEIFDTHFVNSNVYSGVAFNNEHGYNLHQFVIGAAGVTLRQQIETNKADKAAARIEIDRIKTLLVSQVGHGLSITEMGDFLNINPNDANGIDAKIAVAQTQLLQAQSAQIIQTLSLLTPLVGLNLPFDIGAIIADLQTTTQQIQDQTLQQLFADHCSDLRTNGLSEPERWLRSGYDYVKSKYQAAPTVPVHCPFCKQQLVAQFDIMRAYAQKFNDAFNALIARLENYRIVLQTYSVPAALQPIQHLGNQNTTYSNTWGQYLSNVQAPVFNFLPTSVSIQTLLSSMIAIVQQKISNPTIAPDITTLQQFGNLVHGINTNVATYNLQVTTFNQAITSFRSALVTVPVALVNVNLLTRIKMRFDPAIAILCNQLTVAGTNLNTLEVAYPGLMTAQDTAATNFFSQYGTSVNNYLSNIFKTPFQIANVQNVRPVGRGTQSRFGYEITINGQPVMFDTNQPNSTKECLSEGDKSTIAFSFFMAKLDNDPNLADKVVIVDDPLSSLDSRRRQRTIGQLITLSKKVKQLVVLSHDGRFLYDLNSRLYKITRPKGLQLTFDSATDSSLIEPFKIEKALQNAYFKSLDRMKDFISTGTDAGKDDVRGEIRKALEAAIMFKFYNALGGNVQGMFGQLIETLSNELTAGRLAFRDANGAQVIADLRELNGMSWDVHHGDSDLLNSVTPPPATSISLDELKDYLRMTLNLIDNRL